MLESSRMVELIALFTYLVSARKPATGESKWCVPTFEWRRFIIFGRIKVILTIYRLI